MSFDPIAQFEKSIAEFFGAPYAVAVDCCTHGVELCLRYKDAKYITSPKHTYISIPFLSKKLGISLIWKDENWTDFYTVWSDNHTQIIDAAVLWGRDTYVPGTFMNVSFQFRKHLSLGRGGVILCDSKEAAIELKKMSYDGRLPDVPWRDQDISTMGYHYYMTPETAHQGLNKLELAMATKPMQWTIEDWPDLTEMSVFNNGNFK